MRRSVRRDQRLDCFGQRRPLLCGRFVRFFLRQLPRPAGHPVRADVTGLDQLVTQAALIAVRAKQGAILVQRHMLLLFPSVSGGYFLQGIVFALIEAVANPLDRPHGFLSCRPFRLLLACRWLSKSSFCPALDTR
jgi:hypothetical protein